MPPYVSLDDIRESVETGVKKALKTYEKMTPDFPLVSVGLRPENFIQRVPESFIQSHIALELKKECCVSLETTSNTLRAALGESNPERGGHSKKYDIVIWWDVKKGARFAIEIKRVHRDINCNYDTEKLRQAIEKGWVERGMIVVYATATKPETITNRFDKIYKNIEKKCGNKISVEKFPHKKPEKLGDDYWSVAWFEMHGAHSEASKSVRVRG